MAATSVFLGLGRGIISLRQSAKAGIRWQVPIKRHLNTSVRLLTGRKFSSKHEWVETSESSSTVGITNYAQESLGDIVYAQLPEVDAEFGQGDECGALESVKAASELYSPVSGKVVEVNSAVEEQPSLINKSPYAEGWLFKIQLTKPEELDNLMGEAEYETYVKTLET